MMDIKKTMNGWYIIIKSEDKPVYLPIMELLGDLVLSDSMRQVASARVVEYLKASGINTKYITDDYKQQLVNLLELADLPFEIHENS